MKNVSISILLTAVAFLGSSCAMQRAQMPLEEETCVEIGLDARTSFCRAYTYNYTGQYYFNEVFLVKEGVRIDAVGMGDGSEINYMLVSPSRQYAALEMDGGEGHPYLSIMALEEIRQGREPRYTGEYEPYPGGLWGFRWQGDKLLFKTDKELPVENGEPGETNSCEVTYAIDAETGKLVQIGEPVPLQ